MKFLEQGRHEWQEDGFRSWGRSRCSAADDWDSPQMESRSSLLRRRGCTDGCVGQRPHSLGSAQLFREIWRECFPLRFAKEKKQANTPADALRCKQEERREVGGEKREERGQKRNQNLGPRGLGSCVITPTVIREDLSSSNRQRRG